MCLYRMDIACVIKDSAGRPGCLYAQIIHKHNQKTERTHWFLRVCEVSDGMLVLYVAFRRQWRDASPWSIMHVSLGTHVCSFSKTLFIGEILQVNRLTWVWVMPQSRKHMTRVAYIRDVSGCMLVHNSNIFGQERMLAESRLPTCIIASTTSRGNPEFLCTKERKTLGSSHCVHPRRRV